jgi:hypothetical protein
VPYFTQLEYKNLQSIGNHPIKIQLDKAPHTLIGGRNGSGKCLDKSTKIDIKFESKVKYEHFLEFIKNK